ncbi:hypothetical protein [Synechococcus sp. UW105]|uniref:hypothetical protein n=1 Tax=Synechococcus sp. UW105 TaxID=337067 RepID=UPI001481F787|nr:hypothetical protein [Synechococcus sp. UW105]
MQSSTGLTLTSFPWPTGPTAKAMAPDEHLQMVGRETRIAGADQRSFLRTPTQAMELRA